MKKILCILATLVLLLSSCGTQTEGDPFALFEKAFEANVTLSCNGNTSSFFVRYSPKTELGDEIFELTITSPQQASGYVFAKDGEKYELSFDGISIECNEQLAEYPKIVYSVLSPSAEGIVSIGTEKSDAETLSAVKTADVKYLFSSDGAPFSASGIACGKTVDIIFDSFSHTQSEQ